MLTLGKYSFGMGDRFAHQARAQLRACQLISTHGVTIVPVWNKSHREHTTVGSQPSSVRAAAAEAVAELGWNTAYHIDADHIRLETVETFIDSSDFYTLDVADAIGQPAAAEAIRALLDRHPELIGTVIVPGIAEPLRLSRGEMERIAAKYLAAAQQAGRIYRRIAELKGADNFITEVSMDETDSPQTPLELMVILAALADEKIPLQTIAPKFTGRFNKGVDYVGNLDQFAQEFSDDLAVLAHAVRQYGLPVSLKLSVHSGSDKFSLYAPIRRALSKFGAGLHIKTAGTTWLEELIGLAEADGPGLTMAKAIYAKALAKREALCAPYATVIDIDPAKLPNAETVAGWSSKQFVNALRHDSRSPEFNPHLRQLLHVGYKIAADLGDDYLAMLRQCEATISKNVTLNLYERHLRPLLGK